MPLSASLHRWGENVVIEAVIILELALADVARRMG
jgi:hypothetical protein